MRIETLAVHAGHHTDPTTGAVTPPIHLSTTFEREEDGSYRRGLAYTRRGNPNRDSLEQCLCALEGGAVAAAFSSGSAATQSVFQALSPGDHVIAPNDIYHGIAGMLREVFAPWGLATTFVDMTDLNQLQKAIRRNTKLIWIETPSNPLLKITDITKVAQITHGIGALCVCDNTLATPMLQHPLELGADFVVYAATKYLNGHSDVLLGAVVGKNDNEFFQKIRKIQTYGGSVPSPFECWLLLRGIRTLPYRMRAHSDNAFRVAAFLHTHPRVVRVHYPGLNNHPGHEIAARQMTLFGGVLSIQVNGDKDQALSVAARTKIFTRATSFGGTESLIEHRASVEGPGTRTPENLLRLSIGLENPDDLIEDLAQALE